ncbi:cytochrome c biogenesis CcdA family protein [Nocardioides nanhaiensis]|uniref:Cytochrome c biogenesis CcdA family protein n=1 Tax=Nocardioides nanhaiensis TaxID=1476871 RepID=A0ABP8WBD2_9ACTN
MDTAALTLALTAGALAALNPCGFALLPAYLSLSVLPAADGGPPAVRSWRGTAGNVGRALGATAAMTAGFVLVFGVFGLLISPAASAAQEYLPYVTAATGVLLALVGLALLTGRHLWLPLPRISRGGGSGLAATVGYGVVYAVASLTCTVGPFLAIVVTSLRSDAPAEGVALFAVYALGMGAVVGVAAIAVALASGTLLRGMRGAGRWLPRAAGALVLVVGLYVAWYGVWEVRVLGGADPADPVVDTALQLQQWLNDQLRRVLPGA